MTGLPRLCDEEFLRRHWQKTPRLQTRALPPGLPQIDADELAWLATLDDVESRLVFTEVSDSATQYRLEQGPFAENTLQSLPDTGWTLLVQDVEKHLPELRAWFSIASCTPEWRIDDLMISFAAPGGGVGPHTDHYDVFLCQGEGRREWRLSGTAQPARQDDSEGLILVEPFEDPNPLVVSGGDVLYLPPGIAHWGIAVDPCLTLSVGMRAPTAAEMRLTFDREFPGTANPFREDRALFYRDEDLEIHEAVDGRISSLALARCSRLMSGTAPALSNTAITLGCTVTDPKAWLVPDPVTPSQTRDWRHSVETGVPAHGMARLTHWEGENEHLLFANGHWRPVAQALAGDVRRLCVERKWQPTAPETSDCQQMTTWLLETGALDPHAA